MILTTAFNIKTYFFRKVGVAMIRSLGEEVWVRNYCQNPARLQRGLSLCMLQPTRHLLCVRVKEFTCINVSKESLASVDAVF